MHFERIELVLMGGGYDRADIPMQLKEELFANAKCPKGGYVPL